MGKLRSENGLGSGHGHTAHTAQIVVVVIGPVAVELVVLHGAQMMVMRVVVMMVTAGHVGQTVDHGQTGVAPVPVGQNVSVGSDADASIDSAVAISTADATTQTPIAIGTIRVGVQGGQTSGRLQIGNTLLLSPAKRGHELEWLLGPKT